MQRSTVYAMPFTHLFILAAFKKIYCRRFYHLKRNLLEVMTLPVGSREAETWHQ